MFGTSRSKCKKCGIVFELTPPLGAVFVRISAPTGGSPALPAGRGSWFNVRSSVKDPAAWLLGGKGAEPPVWRCSIRQPRRAACPMSNLYYCLDNILFV